jgi:signal peptidase I
MADKKNAKADVKKPKNGKAKGTTAKVAEEPQQHSTLREYYVTTAVMTIFALFVTTYVVHPMTVPTPSMVPTILVGDRLLIDKFTVRNGFIDPLPLTPVHKIKRKDVIVFKYPNEPEILYVKRAIGLPGETIAIRDKQVYINGQALNEPYAVHIDPSIRPYHFFGGTDPRDNMPPEVIPPKSYFMMGDNRDDSADSRYFGFLPESHIVGRPLVVFWSYEDDPDAYKLTGSEVLGLYVKRIIYFFPRTRWSRTGHIVR